MKAIGNYIFAGGFTVGVKRHFDVVAHLEGDAYGTPTARLNWPDLDIRYGKEKWKPKEFSEIDFIYANPPCAIFSPMGIVTTQGADSWKVDPRLDCWKNAVGLFEELKPGAFALESVCQAYTRGREIVDEFTRRALGLGYSVTHLLLDAQWTGLPQSRKRFFLVFHRPSKLVGYQFNWAPSPTAGETLREVDAPGYFTVHSRKDWPALVEATPQGERLANTWESLHPGFENVRNAQGNVAGRPSFQDRRLRADEVMGAWVGDKFYHPTENRAIGVEEAKALCGYPPEFKIAPVDLKGFGSLLARAVMPPVGEWLARAVAATLRSTVGGPLTVTRIDVRKPSIDPVDLTDEYIDENGRPRPAVKGRISFNTDEEEDDGGHQRVNGSTNSRDHSEVRPAATTAGDDRRTPGGARQQAVPGDYRAPPPHTESRVTLAPATSASSLHGPEEAAPRKDAGEVRVSQDCAPSVHRHEPSGESDVSKVYDVIAEVVGVEPGVVKRVATALQFSRSVSPKERASVVATMTGIDLEFVLRISAALPVIAGSGVSTVRSSPPSGEVGAPSPQTVDTPPPAGEAVATRGRRSVEPVVREPAVETPQGDAGSATATYTAEDRHPMTDEPCQFDPVRPADGEGSGAFIRRLLMADRHAPEAILATVLRSYEGRKTTIKDVYWNYQKLLKDGCRPPAWRGSKTPGGYPGSAKTPAVARPVDPAPVAPTAPRATVVRAAGAAASPSVRVVGGPLNRVALVEWYPRVCGSVAFGGHLSTAMKGLDRITFSKSGEPRKDWWDEWEWTPHRTAGAVELLNSYDAVFFVDIACFSPNVQKSKGAPYYAEIYEKLTVPYSGMFHGGLYPSKYDEVIDALVRGPAFSGSLLTTRLAQAKDRLKKWPGLRFVHHPYLPYDDSWARNVKPEKVNKVMMTARLASNKGQNALLAILDKLDCDVDIRGYNSFGLPSIAWRLHELGTALGYREDGPPALRSDKADLTHPNAPKFYTGKFGFTSPSGRRFAYHDGFDRREDVDWSPWLHASLPSRAFGDTLEYVTLDAIAAGCVAVVPATSVTEAKYDNVVTVPYEGCSVWADDNGNVKGSFDGDALAATVNGLLRTTNLHRVASLQREEIKSKHSVIAAWAAAEHAIRGSR